MKARLGTDKVVHFFDSGSEVGVGTFVAKVVDSSGTVHSEVSMSQVLSVPNLYLSDGFNLTESGIYDVFYVYDGVVIYRESVEAGEPLSDVVLGESAVFSVPEQDLGGDDQTVTVYVLDSKGETHIEAGEDDPVPAPYDADYNSYTASLSFDDEGDYFLVWANDGVPFAANHVVALKPYGLEHVRFYVATLQGNNGTPHIETTVVVSKSGGKQIETGITNLSGILNLKIAPGDYIVSIIKNAVVFSINNFNITVGNSSLEELGDLQAYQLLTESFSPTVSDPLSIASMCTMFASIYRMDGSPLAHAPVHVRMLTKPQLYDGTTVYDSQLYFKTDSNGRVSFELIQGIKVEVAIPPMGLRRIIEVPSGDDAAEPVNLFALLSEAKDLFDIQKPQIQTAPRRTR